MGNNISVLFMLSKVLNTSIKNVSNMNIISFLGGISPDDSIFVGIALICCSAFVLTMLFFEVIQYDSIKKVNALFLVFIILLISGVSLPSISSYYNCVDENIELKTVLVANKFIASDNFYFYDSDTRYLMHGDEVAFRYEKIESNTTYMIRLNAIAGNLSCHERERNK